MRRSTGITTLLLFAAAALCQTSPVSASSPGRDTKVAHITVDASKILRSVNPLLYGVNTARWDESLFPGPDSEMLLTCDRDAIAKLKASGVTMLKYPGGNDADSYVWNAPQNNPSEMSTDEYIALCREVGAEPFITINFNAPPELAVSWVRYCKERGYRVKYWEVGDEQWGTWAKGHTSPEAYAQKYVAFVRAMRAVDPGIKVATNVPLGPHPENWASRVMKAAGEYVDMLTVTYYPQQWGKENDDSLLASTELYKQQFTALRRDVASVVGTERADAILYVNVGYNSVNHSPGPQTVQMVNALWVADMLGAMAESGTDVACYWAVHNAFPPRGGDYGFLSSEGNNTPRYSYYVFPLFRQHFGTELVRASSSSPSLSVYAALKGKTLSLAVINKERVNTTPFSTQFEGFSPKETVRRWLLNESHEGQELTHSTLRSGRLEAELPPYSVTLFECVAQDSIDAPANLATFATASSSSFSTIGAHFGPSSAIDGKSYTRWNSAAWTKSGGQEKQWLTLAWERPEQISLVRIAWGESHAASYQIETSDDSLRWNVMARVPEGKGGVEQFQFAPVRARYLRVNGALGTKGISAYSIREIEVYAAQPTGTK